MIDNADYVPPEQGDLPEGLWLSLNFAQQQALSQLSPVRVPADILEVWQRNSQPYNGDCQLTGCPNLGTHLRNPNNPARLVFFPNGRVYCWYCMRIVMAEYVDLVKRLQQEMGINYPPLAHVWPPQD